MNESSGPFKPQRSRVGNGGPRYFLRPRAEVFEANSDELQICLVNHTVTFVGSPVVQCVQALVDVLVNGEERETAVSRAVSVTSAGRGFVDYVFGMMLDNGCLRPGNSSQSDGDELGDLPLFYASTGHDPEQVLSVLNAANPCVITPEADHAILGEVLREAGLRVQPIAIEPGESCGVALKRVKSELATGGRLLLSWNFAYRAPFNRDLCVLAGEAATPILFGTCEGVVGRIGPFYYPGESACLECLNRRQLANGGEPELRAYHQYRMRYDDRVGDSPVSHPVFRQVIVRLLIIELTSILLRRPPQTVGRVIEHTFGMSGTEEHTVLRVPTCEICHSATPRRLPWDVRFPAPLVKSASS